MLLTPQKLLSWGVSGCGVDPAAIGQAVRPKHVSLFLGPGDCFLTYDAASVCFVGCGLEK
jgi:hypothetical protein